VSKLIPHKAISLPRMDHSVVFARWCRCAPPAIWYVVPWAAPTSVHPKWHLIWFSRFCRAHQCAQYISTSEVTTLWHYTNLFIIIIFLIPVLNSQWIKKITLCNTKKVQKLCWNDSYSSSSFTKQSCSRMALYRWIKTESRYCYYYTHMDPYNM